jgi:hypothetical protein
MQREPSPGAVYTGFKTQPLATPVPGGADAAVVCEQSGRHPVGEGGGREDAHHVERLCHNDRLGADTEPEVVVDESQGSAEAPAAYIRRSDGFLLP